MNNPTYQQPPVIAETSGWAIFSLISGILGWLGVFGLGGLLAIIAGHIAKSQIRNSQGRCWREWSGYCRIGSGVSQHRIGCAGRMSCPVGFWRADQHASLLRPLYEWNPIIKP